MSPKHQQNTGQPRHNSPSAPPRFQKLALGIARSTMIHL